jgi:cytochrome P450 family 307 subfamily A
MVSAFDEIFWEINQGYLVDFLPILSNPFYNKHMQKLENWAKEIRTFILDRIIDVREQQLEDGDEERDFTDALLKQLKNEENVTRDTIIFMLEDFLGGHSAIGNLVMLALGHIAKKPEIGKRIQEEVDKVTRNGSRKINLNDAETCPFTVSTIFEVLRCCSSPIVPHVATVRKFDKLFNRSLIFFSFNKTGKLFNFRIWNFKGHHR